MARLRLVRGNTACAYGALSAGCRFYAGYPITPSSEVAEEMARLLPRVGGVFVQMEDEMASLAACIGASLGGLRSMTATSGPGFTLMQEHLGYAALAEIPCVVVNVMRLGPSTGFPTAPAQGDVLQARWGSHGDYPMVVLAPAGVQEVFELTAAAFEVADRFRTPVVVLYDEVVGHMMEPATLPELSELVASGTWRRPSPPVQETYLPYAYREGTPPPLVSFGEGPRYHVTGLIHDESGFPTQDPGKVGEMLRQLNGKLPEIPTDQLHPELVATGDAEVVVVAYGITARAARAAVRQARELGVRAGLFRPRVLWPSPATALRELSGRVGMFVVAEMNFGQWAREVERLVGRWAEVATVNQVDGTPLSPQAILERVLEVTGPVPSAAAGRKIP
ncbi:MAG: 2-oxoacid:acceptor oxidoreductase subunit alpha [Armatimonadota bacterium]|nr:2-oxoacid:acceptor oxidoreductase subunit alpha [Armatimonadota bacterium]